MLDRFAMRYKIAPLLDVRLLIIGLVFMVNISAVSQDGSNIRYLKPENLNSSHVGKICHIDFGSISFRNKARDTVQIEVNGKTVSFVERRLDNGFNNWFHKQYVEALPLRKNLSTRLTSSTIDSLTSKRIYVKSILRYYINGNPIDTISVINHFYLKRNVANVLLKVDR